MDARLSLWYVLIQGLRAAASGLKIIDTPQGPMTIFWPNRVGVVVLGGQEYYVLPGNAYATVPVLVRSDGKVRVTCDGRNRSYKYTSRVTHVESYLNMHGREEFLAFNEFEAALAVLIEAVWKDYQEIERRAQALARAQREVQLCEVVEAGQVF